MSCGSCSEKTKAGAALATGGPVATGTALARHCPLCGHFLPNDGPCVNCNTAKPARELTSLTDDEYTAAQQAAIDWQYLTVSAGRMARKSELDQWLMQRYGLDQNAAHTISNSVDDKIHFRTGAAGVQWIESAAKRPAPSLASYPDMAATDEDEDDWTEEAHVQECPRCHASCNDDPTIGDHGMCIDCFHERGNVDAEDGEDQDGQPESVGAPTLPAQPGRTAICGWNANKLYRNSRPQSQGAGHRTLLEIWQAHENDVASGNDNEPISAKVLQDAVDEINSANEAFAAIGMKQCPICGEFSDDGHVCPATKGEGFDAPEHPMSDDEWKARMRLTATGILAAPPAKPTVTAPVASAPAFDHTKIRTEWKTSPFQKGARVALANGRHGTVAGDMIVSVSGFGIRPHEELSGIYVQTDNGSTQHVSVNDIEDDAQAIQVETARPEQVALDPVLDGEPVQPDDVVYRIHYERNSAQQQRGAGRRARLDAKKREYTRKAQLHDQKAAEAQAVFDAWAQHNPGEARALLDTMEKGYGALVRELRSKSLPAAASQASAPPLGSAPTSTLPVPAPSNDNPYAGNPHKATATFTTYKTKPSVEIRFPDKPPENVRDELHRVGFTWSRPQRKWYAPGDQDTDDFARKLAGGSQCPMCGNFVSGDGQGHKPTCGQGSGTLAALRQEMEQTRRDYEAEMAQVNKELAESRDVEERAGYLEPSAAHRSEEMIVARMTDIQSKYPPRLAKLQAEIWRADPPQVRWLDVDKSEILDWGKDGKPFNFQEGVESLGRDDYPLVQRLVDEGYYEIVPGLRPSGHWIQLTDKGRYAISPDGVKAQATAREPQPEAPQVAATLPVPAPAPAPTSPFSAAAPEVQAFIGLLHDEKQARYAQQYAEYLARERDEPDKPRQVSDASAHSIRYRLDQIARPQSNRGEASTQVAPLPIPQQTVAIASQVAATPPPFNASDQTVQDYLAQLTPVQREYAQRYAAYVEQGRVGKEPSILPRQVSHAMAQSIRSRINQMASERFVQGAATTPAQPSGAASRVAIPAAPGNVSRCDQCGQWKGPSHVCAKSEAESAVCRMDDTDWRAYQKTLKTPDGKPDHKALARAMHLRESGAEAELLGALADVGTGRLPTTELSDLPVTVAVANGALRRLRENGMVSEQDSFIALSSAANLRGNYPPSLDTSAKRALFDSLGNDEQLALALDAAIQSVKKDDWRDTVIKRREVRNAIIECLNDDEALADRIFELVKSQPEY